MKKELKSCILSADKSADHRPTVGGVNVIAVVVLILFLSTDEKKLKSGILSADHRPTVGGANVIAV